MSELWLVQYLCPARHAIVAAQYDTSETTAAVVEREVLELMAQASINPWCGICGSRELQFEHGRLREQDPAKALEQLRQEEAKQQVTRALIGGRF